MAMHPYACQYIHSFQSHVFAMANDYHLIQMSLMMSTGIAAMGCLPIWPIGPPDSGRA